jgi:hypothetical protein
MGQQLQYGSMMNVAQQEFESSGLSSVMELNLVATPSPIQVLFLVNNAWLIQIRQYQDCMLRQA